MLINRALQRSACSLVLSACAGVAGVVGVGANSALASGPAIEQAVVVAPGTVGLIRASPSRGLLERREPGGMPLASPVGVQNSPGCNTPLTYAGQVFTGGALLCSRFLTPSRLHSCSSRWWPSRSMLPT